MKTFYNEIDRYAAQWLRNLGDAGHIAQGHVEETPIEKLTKAQLEGFDRLHFFAGIGGWDYALHLAGWPEAWPVWTGSCPCQPFSAAGKQGGEQDERHLWPSFFQHITQHRPSVIFGEQVASNLGRQWLAGIRADLEKLGYRFGAADLCAASVGAPHIRQRLFWVAYASDFRYRDKSDSKKRKREPIGGRQHGRMVNAVDQRLEGQPGNGHGGEEPGRLDQEEAGSIAEAGPACGMEKPSSLGRGRRSDGNSAGDGREIQAEGRGSSSRMGDADGQRLGVLGNAAFPRSGRHPLGPDWTRFDLLWCRDEKTRRIEPGTFPLVDGLSFKLGSGSPFANKSRTGLLKGYGNAINPWVAKIFIESVIDFLTQETAR